MKLKQVLISVFFVGITVFFLSGCSSTSKSDKSVDIQLLNFEQLQSTELKENGFTPDILYIGIEFKGYGDCANNAPAYLATVEGTSVGVNTIFINRYQDPPYVEFMNGQRRSSDEPRDCYYETSIPQPFYSSLDDGSGNCHGDKFLFAVKVKYDTTGDYQGTKNFNCKEVLSALNEPSYQTQSDDEAPTTIDSCDNTISEMVLIPASQFILGCSQTDEGCKETDFKFQKVFVDAYCIDKYEVTNAVYKSCVDAGGCTLPQETSSRTRSSYYDNPTYANYPVINVFWDQADTFCKWVGKQLPTEAQWEKAARGDEDARSFPWGEMSPDCSVTNFSGCVGDTAEVGSYPDGASPYGVMDMSGNVWEWVQDAIMDRGGSWHPTSLDVRISLRGQNGPGWYGDTNGFRCADSVAK